MTRTTGAIGWKTKQHYLHEKFPDQGWMEETDKKVINEHYKSVFIDYDKKLSQEIAQELKMGY